MKRLLPILLVLGLVVPLGAEVKYFAVSATATAQTIYFNARVSSFLMCNFGSNEIYYRVFEWNEAPADATTSYATLVAGTSTAPICKTFAGTPTLPYYGSISIVCAAAETATVQIETQ